jgi:hypothetical protein
LTADCGFCTFLGERDDYEFPAFVGSMHLLPCCQRLLRSANQLTLGRTGFGAELRFTVVGNSSSTSSTSSEGTFVGEAAFVAVGHTQEEAVDSSRATIRTSMYDRHILLRRDGQRYASAWLVSSTSYSNNHNKRFDHHGHFGREEAPAPPINTDTTCS